MRESDIVAQEVAEAVQKTLHAERDLGSITDEEIRSLSPEDQKILRRGIRVYLHVKRAMESEHVAEIVRRIEAAQE